MKEELFCPVCGYKDISGNICPNCATDLSVIRSLSELNPVVANAQLYQLFTKWQAIAALLLVLLIGIGLGAVGSSVFLQAQIITKVVNSPPQETLSGNSATQILPSLPTASPPISQETASPQKKPSQLNRYTVKPGDSLSLIAERFYGNQAFWTFLVKVNPTLKGRKDLLWVGEELIVPQRPD